MNKYKLKLPLNRCPDYFSTHHTCVRYWRSNYINVACITSINDVWNMTRWNYDAATWHATITRMRTCCPQIYRITGDGFEHCESRKNMTQVRKPLPNFVMKTQLRPPFFHWSIMYPGQPMLCAWCHQGANFSVAIRQAASVRGYFGGFVQCWLVQRHFAAMGDLLFLKAPCDYWRMRLNGNADRPISF